MLTFFETSQSLLVRLHYLLTYVFLNWQLLHSWWIRLRWYAKWREWVNGERERERERICIHNFHFEYCCINRANNILLHALDSSFISFKVVSLCHVDNQVDIMTLLYIVIIWNTLLFHLKINVHCSCITSINRLIWIK